MDFSLSESSHWIDAPVVIEEQLSRFEIPRGYVFGVELDGQPVGAVFVADGTWTIRFERPSDAKIAANRLAVLEKVPKSDLVSVVAEQELKETFDRGYLLGNEIWSELSPKLAPVHLKGGSLLRADKGAAEEILVLDARSLTSARNIAEEVLRERVEWMRRYAFDPQSLLVADRYQPDALHTRFGEFRTGQSWDRFAGETELTAEQPWLFYIRDPSGAFAREDRAQVLAQGLLNERLVRHPVSRERFPEDSDGIHRAPQRIDLAAASATALWNREGSGLSQIATVVADLRLTAVGGPARLVWLDVPHVEQQRSGGDTPLVEKFELEKVETTDGRPLQVFHLPLTSDQREGRGYSRTYVVLLPEELEKGEVFDVRVSWSDRHRYAHRGGAIVGYGRGNTPLYANDNLGTSTDPVLVLPRVRTHSGAGGPARIRVGVRPWVASHDKVAVSGVRTDSFLEGGYRYVESETTTTLPIMILGQWDESFDPAKMGFPAVRSLMQTQGSEVPKQIPVEVRSVLNGWKPLLPDYPAGEVQLAELFMSPYGTRLWLAGDGVVPIQPWLLRRSGPRAPELYVRNKVPHLERWAVTAALHGHWWTSSGLPPGTDDLPRTVSTIYGIKTLGARFGREVEDEWFDLMRINASTADHRVDGYIGGAFALGRTLTDEIGDAPLYAAIDRVLSGELPPTTDGLQQALELTTGRDLDDFFDLWLRAGLSPKVEASWKRVGDEVHLTLESDVPFAKFAVPVRVFGPNTDRNVLVTIDGGLGSAVIPVDNDVRGIEIDPEKRMLLLRRGDYL